MKTDRLLHAVIVVEMAVTLGQMPTIFILMAVACVACIPRVKKWLET